MNRHVHLHRNPTTPGQRYSVAPDSWATKSTPKRSGFFLADVLFALGIVGVLTVVLASAMRQEMSASKRSADSRAAGRLAEHAMLDLQQGQALPATANDVHIVVRPASGGHAPAGYAWAAVEARVDGHRATMFGLAPAQSVQKAQP